MSEPDEILEGQVVEDGPNVAALAIRDHRPGDLTRPAAPIAEIEAAFKAYQDVCRKIIEPADLQTIGGKQFRKRSAWRKLSVAFSVTYEIVDRVRVLRDPTKPLSSRNPVVYAEFVVRAQAAGGRFADGWGACDAFERCCLPGCKKGRGHDHCPNAATDWMSPGDCPGVTHFSHANHDIPATAETRAKNRAAADLFGMGEVSAEEVVGEGESAPVDTTAGRGRSGTQTGNGEPPPAPSSPTQQPNQAAPKEESTDPNGPPTRAQWAEAREQLGGTNAILKLFIERYPNAPKSTAAITQAQLGSLLKPDAAAAS